MTVARRWSRSAREAATRIAEVDDDRRRWLDDRLGDWPDGDLSEFVRMLASYNAALDA